MDKMDLPQRGRAHSLLRRMYPLRYKRGNHTAQCAALLPPYIFTRKVDSPQGNPPLKATRE